METRVQKYKEYRSSFVKEGSQKYNGQERFTTSTLPLNEVMNTVNEENAKESLINDKNKMTALKYVLVTIIAICLIVGVVFLGIFAFKG